MKIFLDNADRARKTCLRDWRNYLAKIELTGGVNLCIKLAKMVTASDIDVFFLRAARDQNDAANKIREGVINLMPTPPAHFLSDPEFGDKWQNLQAKFNEAIPSIAAQGNVPAYTSVKIKPKGGRRAHYDFDFIFCNGPLEVASLKVEFKNGGINIGDQPQFLSLQAKFALFHASTPTYDQFWYENHLDNYLACDSGITATKPSLEAFLKAVTSTTYRNPFFAQLKARELTSQAEKDGVVNTSIRDWLNQYARTIDLAKFAEKVKETQQNKIYMIWNQSRAQFLVDKMIDEEMTNMTFRGIKNDNVLEVVSGNTTYGLLLRWRNHKGILNPAWQISMKRAAV